MNYITAKETRVEKAWNKRGLAGLRTELLQKIAEQKFYDWDDQTLVHEVCRTIFWNLPKRDWNKGFTYAAETLGLVGIDLDDWSSEFMVARLNEETLREDIGDGFDD